MNKFINIINKYLFTDNINKISMMSSEELIKEFKNVSTVEIVRVCFNRIIENNKDRYTSMNNMIEYITYSNHSLITETMNYFIKAPTYRDKDFYHKTFYISTGNFKEVIDIVDNIKEVNPEKYNKIGVDTISQLLDILTNSDIYDIYTETDSLSNKYNDIDLECLFKILAYRIENIKVELTAENCGNYSIDDLVKYKKYSYLCYILTLFNDNLVKHFGDYKNEDEEEIRSRLKIFNESNCLFEKEFLRTGSILTIMKILNLNLF